MLVEVDSAEKVVIIGIVGIAVARPNYQYFYVVISDMLGLMK